MASNPAPAPTALPAQVEGTRALRAAVEDKSRRTKHIEGLRALREGPDAKSVFLLDQFGVLHDGKTAYPCAIDTTRRLCESGARLFIISNSSRRASGTLKKLEKLGFDPDWFEGVITSGEITHARLNARNETRSSSTTKLLAAAAGSESELSETETPRLGKKPEKDSLDEAFGELGDRCLHFTWSTRGPVALDGIEGLVTVDAESFLKRVETKEAARKERRRKEQAGGAFETNESNETVANADDANANDAKARVTRVEKCPKDDEVGAVDFLLAHGTECVNGAGESDEERALTSADTPIEEMKTLLTAAAKESLPLVVANPDLVTVGGEAGLLPMPGTLAAWYSEMEGAGPIYLMGKPSLVVYETLAELTNASKSETVAVGDSLEHDVNGAAAYGIDVVFVCGGIHAEELGYDADTLIAQKVGDGKHVPAVNAAAVEKLADDSNCARPTVAVPVFRW
jgi:ribonucleotide monophosphatase NagD (HAD superfamily)